MRNLDFSSWQALFSTLLGLSVITLIMVGIRLIVMQTMQQRRERENRQINERLKTLISAYKILGGSFTGDLAVDPTHLRDLQPGSPSSDRSRRIRDAVEAALSDVILLGTEEQVRLASRAAADLAAGRPTGTDELVVQLRDFIRKVLDLDAVPRDFAVPKQGPLRNAGAGSAKARDGGERGSAKGGGGQGGAGMAAGGMGMGAGVALGHETDKDHQE